MFTVSGFVAGASASSHTVAFSLSPQQTVRNQYPSAPLDFSYHATPVSTQCDFRREKCKSDPLPYLIRYAYHMKEPSSKFEVTVNGVLCHTKVGDGGLLPAGFPDSEAKLRPIFALISAALEGGTE